LLAVVAVFPLIVYLGMRIEVAGLTARGLGFQNLM
jgi:hypothetical protein